MSYYDFYISSISLTTLLILSTPHETMEKCKMLPRFARGSDP